MKWGEYSSLVFKECKKREVPFFACFELTPFCNFSCNMCYIRLSREQARLQGSMLSTDQWIQLAEEAKKMGTLTLEITGGEACTRKDFKELYKSFAKMGFLINLRTNGYLLSGELVDLLKQYRPRSIGITIYGASDETYNKICGVSDGFTVVIKNILALKREGFDINLTMTVTRDNTNDTKKIKEWANSNGFNIQFYGGLFTPIRGAKRSIDHLRIENDYSYCFENTNIEFEPRIIQNRQFYMSPFWMCNGFGAMFCISWDGRVTLCNSMTEIWKDPFANGLCNAYHSLYKDLKNVQRPEKCQSCQYIDYCGACPTRIISETGNLNVVSEKICSRTRFIYNALMTQNSKKSGELV